MTLALQQYGNQATTTLNGAINNAVTSIVVNSASQFKDFQGNTLTGNFSIQIDNEILYVTTTGGGLTWTVVRGAEYCAGSNTPASHSNGAAVTLVLTGASLAVRGGTYVVTDYGVTTSSSDVSTAFNNLINSLPVNGSHIHIPAGVYTSLNTIDFSPLNSFVLTGEGIRAGSDFGTTIKGSVAGILGKFQPASGTGNFYMYGIAWNNTQAFTGATNNSPSGATPVTFYVGTSILNLSQSEINYCQFTGNIGLVLDTQIFGMAVRNCQFLGNRAGNPLCVGIMAQTAGGFVIDNCQGSNWYEAIRHSGTTLVILGGRYEVNTYAIRVGVTISGSSTITSGFTAQGVSLESNGVGYQLEATNNATITGGGSGGFDYSYQPVYYGVRITSAVTNVSFNDFTVNGSFRYAAVAVENVYTNISWHNSNAFNNYTQINAVSNNGSGVYQIQTVCGNYNLVNGMAVTIYGTGTTADGTWTIGNVTHSMPAPAAHTTFTLTGSTYVSSVNTGTYILNYSPSPKVWDVQGGLTSLVTSNSNFQFRPMSDTTKSVPIQRHGVFQSLRQVSLIYPDVEGKNMRGKFIPVVAGATTLQISFTPAMSGVSYGITGTPPSIDTATSGSPGVANGTYLYTCTLVSEHGESAAGCATSDNIAWTTVDGATFNVINIHYSTKTFGQRRRVYRGQASRAQITNITGNPAVVTASFSGTVSAATNATPIVITSTTPHGLQRGAIVTISGALVNTNANGTFLVEVLSPTTFSLYTLANAPVAGNGVYTSGGTWTSGHGLHTGDNVQFFGVGGATGVNTTGSMFRVIVLSSTTFSVSNNAGGTYVGTVNANAVITGAASSGITNNNGGNMIRITCAAGHGMINPGAPSGNNRLPCGVVNISGVVGTTEANGLWTALYWSFTQFDLMGSTFTNNYSSGGTYNTGAYIVGWDGYFECNINDTQGSPYVDQGQPFTTLASPPVLGSPDETSMIELDSNYAVIPTASWGTSAYVTPITQSTTGFTITFGTAAPSAGARVAGSITGATNATPIVITSNGHGLSNGDLVVIYSATNTAANGGPWVVASVTANTFALTGSIGDGTSGSGGTWTTSWAHYLIVR